MTKDIFSIRHLFPNFKRKVLVVAEIGINHEGSLDKCLELILKAKKSGADAIKIQTMDPDLNYCKDSKSFSVFNQSELTIQETQEIFKFCNQKNINIFTTFGDLKTMEWILKLKPFALKISSGLLNHLPLVEKLLQSSLPVIFSTGMANRNDLLLMKNLMRKYKKKNISALHCISMYPTKRKYINLDSISYLKKFFKIPIGYSDHTKSVIAPTSAVLCGAVIIEKHFTLNTKRKGFDHSISFDEKRFSMMVKKIRRYEQLLFSEDFNNVKSTQRKVFSRCLLAKRNIDKNEIIDQTNIIIKRPINKNLRGLEPKYFYEILGKKVKNSILKDHPIKKQSIYE